jgi:hypothetical protein
VEIFNISSVMMRYETLLWLVDEILIGKAEGESGGSWWTHPTREFWYWKL